MSQAMDIIQTIILSGSKFLVSLHGVTENVKKLGNKKVCGAMFGDSVYAYHDFATRKNDGSPMFSHVLIRHGLRLTAILPFLQNFSCTHVRLCLFARSVAEQTRVSYIRTHATYNTDVQTSDSTYGSDVTWCLP